MHGFAHSPLTLLIVQLIVIIGVSRLIGRGARWLGQPLVIAEVLAGIVLGPSLLGWLAPGVMEALFPQSSMGILKMLSQVGLILFMFLIGLELDPKLLKGRGHASVAISHTSIIVPFALGAGAAALWFHRLLAEPSVSFSSFVLFMGVAMSITAFPVLARILTERRLLQSRVGAIAITCAAVDDVTGWCLLAFVVSIVRASDLTHAAWTTLFTVLYIAFMLFAVRPFLARLGARVASRDGLTQNVVAATLVLLLASSWATEFIGIHALFGAFMLGAIIPKQGGLAESLAEKLEDVAVVLLLPVFFAYSGLRTEVGLLNSAGSWVLCGAIILLACLGKFGGSAVAARLTGLRWREAGAVGILMNTRGLMELIVLNIGLDLGVISPKLFTMMVVMALVTTFLTTPLLRWIYPFEQMAQDRVIPAPGAPVAAPAAFTVMMCVSHGNTGPAMVTLAQALTGADKQDAQLYALHLIPSSERASFHLRHEAQPPSESALAPLLERASRLSVPVRPLSFVSTEPGTDICRAAEAKQASLILLGWHKPLLSQTLLGGTVHEVMQEARTKVAVLVDRGLSSVRRVLVPFMGSSHDKAALGLARRLLRNTDAEVTVLHVTSPERKARASAQVEELFPEAGRQVTFKVVRHETPEEAALEEAARGYDLVIVGAGEEWGLEERRWGLHRERIIQESPVSLLVVRRPAPAVEQAPVSEEEALRATDGSAA